MSDNPMEPHHDKSLNICHYLLIVAGIVGCCMNFWQMTKDALEEPTVTKIAYEHHEKLSLPTFSLRPAISVLQMLHQAKILDAVENGSLSYGYMNALLRGIGTDVSEYSWPTNISSPDEIENQYNRAIAKYGSIIQARLALQRDYGVACEDIFYDCVKTFLPFNCCDYVELIWGIHGAQGFAMNWNSTALTSAKDLEVRMRAWPVDNRLYIFDTMEEVSNIGYRLNIQSGVDQTSWSFEIPAALKETVQVKLQQKRRIITTNCTKDPNLKYFRDYDIFACIFEHCMFDQLVSVCNITCQLPLFQLMKPGFSLTNPCGFQDIMKLYVEEPCSRLYDEGCSGKDLPKCYDRCEKTVFQVTFARHYKPSTDNTVEVWMSYDSNEVEVIKDIPRFNFSDYLGLIGGVLGLWLGLSFASMYKIIRFGLAKVAQYHQHRKEKKHRVQTADIVCQSV